MTAGRVLHVLPHAGAGAQTYIDTLTALPGFSFGIFELTPNRSPAAAAANMALRRPALWRAARRADLVHVHGEMASLATLPLLARRRSVVTLHGLHLLRRLGPGLPTRLGRGGLGAIVAAADAIVCVSQTEHDELSWLPGRLRAKLTVVRNGLTLPPPPDPPTRSRVRAAIGLPDDAIAVLYAGQLEPRKDPMTALRAIQRVHARDPRVVLLVAGTAREDGCARRRARTTSGCSGQRSRRARAAQRGRRVRDALAPRGDVLRRARGAWATAVATVVADGSGNPEAVGDAGLVFRIGDDGRAGHGPVAARRRASRRSGRRWPRPAGRGWSTSSPPRASSTEMRAVYDASSWRLAEPPAPRPLERAAASPARPAAARVRSAPADRASAAQRRRRVSGRSRAVCAHSLRAATFVAAHDPYRQWLVERDDVPRSASRSHRS